MSSVAIVFGYVPKVDAVPRHLSRLGFDSRTAVVMDSFRPGCVEMFFDGELFLALLEAAGDVLRADRISISAMDLALALPLTPRARAELRARIADEPVGETLFYRDARTVAAGVSEDWWRVGGPLPYHDSYTLAFYSAEDLSAGLEERVARLGRERGFAISETIRASKEPIPPSLLTRLLARIFG